MILRQCQKFSLSRSLAEKEYSINPHTFIKLQKGAVSTVSSLTRYLHMLKDCCLDRQEFEREALLLVEALMQDGNENSQKIVSTSQKKEEKTAADEPQKTKNRTTRTTLAEQLFFPSSGASALHQLARHIESHPILKEHLAATGYFSTRRGLTEEQAEIIESHIKGKREQ